MSGVISKDKVAAYQRWQIGSFDTQDTGQELPLQEEARVQALSELETVSEQVVSVPLPTADEIEKIYEDARADGYRSGYEEGLKAGEQNRAEATTAELAKLASLTGNLQISLAHMDQIIAEQLLDLALEIAAQVLRDSINARRDILLPVIREAIAALPIHHTRLALHLHPDDASQVRDQIGEQLAQAGTHIIEDPDVSPGGCTLRAGASEIDATIETRWKRVQEALGTTPTEWLNPL